jgi:hypothetical protein
VTGDPQFSDNKNIQRNPNAAGHLKGHRHTAARKSENDDIVATSVVGQFLSELPTSIRTIQKYF